jgi:hypothetical protein
MMSATQQHLMADGDGSMGRGVTTFMASSTMTPLVSVGISFLLKIVTWAASQWSAAVLMGLGWATLPSILVLFDLSVLFNTTGNKKVTVNILGFPRLVQSVS